MSEDKNCEVALAGVRGEDLDILLNVRSYFGGNSLHWHKSAVLSSQIGVGAAAAVAAAAVTVRDDAVNILAFLLCLLIAFFSRSQAVHAMKEFNIAVGVLLKVDRATRVFEVGQLGMKSDEYLYPKEYFLPEGAVLKNDRFLARNAWLAFVGPLMIGALPVLLSIGSIRSALAIPG